MAITIVKPGLLATIQDLGRTGYQGYGIVVGGVMDQGAARVANIIVGNSDDEAVIEFTSAGGEIRIERELLISLCGGDLGATVNGRYVPLWRPVLLNRGDIITFGASRFGSRVYLAVAGGFNMNKVLGSKSTYIRGGLGGHEGRALKAGDHLMVNGIAASSLSAKLITAIQEKRWLSTWHAGQFALADRDVFVIRVMEGTHSNRLSDEAKVSLFGGIFRIGTLSDRMGYRLEGKRALGPLQRSAELLSEAVAIGTVQLPPDGNPIVLLADRQTTGGYPRVAQIATVDIPLFAQLKPGDKILFELITLQTAERLLLTAEHDLTMLKIAVGLKGKE
ncbi:biotin-dependent carboxyltransferase family protein [Paenibacillus sp. GSMTC-2017]|uniref:5-oxoprolinase subunit C family protein n=1 Tax=Paenibacillus sp. GSMTC-2017 TaxID=2794350 RepID=UPI0018D695D9|nr:biotin-dependent carboxyltransferase family protein [Paenibacillus sp. GSMTC-2017]MBH5318989.1 biotin-dependent carboxyltransferase family protein [Paenibacillus sp. GSMTC-2017]